MIGGAGQDEARPACAFQSSRARRSSVTISLSAFISVSITASFRAVSAGFRAKPPGAVCRLA